MIIHPILAGPLSVDPNLLKVQKSPLVKRLPTSFLGGQKPYLNSNVLE